MIVIGLTGSIGMGKTVTAGLFRDEGCPVWDADQAVHRLYGPGGAAVAPIEAAFPGVTADAAVDRRRLAEQLQTDAEAFARLEAIVHPLVSADRAAFLRTAHEAGARAVVLDVPLLFETGRAAEADAVVVASAPPEVQRARVLSRPGMTAARFEALNARQTPDAEKRARADFVIDTSRGIEAARREVRYVLARVTAPGWRSRRSDALHAGAEPGQ